MTIAPAILKHYQDLNDAQREIVGRVRRRATKGPRARGTPLSLTSTRSEPASDRTAMVTRPSSPLHNLTAFEALQESERLTRLINGILDLAKMEAGKTDWQIREIAPKQVIEGALAAMAIWSLAYPCSTSFCFSPG